MECKKPTGTGFPYWMERQELLALDRASINPVTAGIQHLTHYLLHRPGHSYPRLRCLGSAFSTHMELLWMGLTLLVMLQTQAQGPRRHEGLPNVHFHKICLPSLGKERVTMNPGWGGPVPMGRNKKRGVQPSANPAPTSHSLVALETVQVGTRFSVHGVNLRL